jgi:hypothetical protein
LKLMARERRGESATNGVSMLVAMMRAGLVAGVKLRS